MARNAKHQILDEDDDGDVRPVISFSAAAASASDEDFGASRSTSTRHNGYEKAVETQKDQWDDDEDEVKPKKQQKSVQSRPFQPVADPEQMIIRQTGRLTQLADDIFSQNRYLSALAPPSHPPPSSSSSSTAHRSSRDDSKTPLEGGTGDLALAHKWYKRTLIGINAIFIFFGIILCSIGTYGLSSRVVNKLTGINLSVGVVILGVFVILISLVGMCGALRQSRLLLIFYSLILIILFICQISVGIAVYVKREDADSYLISGWNGASNELRIELQNFYLCCGLQAFNETNRGEPCPTQADSARACLPVFQSNFARIFRTVGGVVIAFSLLQLTCMVFGMCLLKRVQELREIREQAPAATTAATAAKTNTGEHKEGPVGVSWGTGGLNLASRA